MTTQAELSWESEYDWTVDSGLPGRPSMGQTSRNNVLSILFDSGAQTRFSRVRITVCCNNKVPQAIRKKWGITPNPLALSVTNRTSSDSAPPNASSLPVYHAVFVADRASPPPGGEVRERGELTLVREHPGGSLHTMFELEQELTEATHNVSFCFTSSRWLYTLIPRGRYFHANTDRTQTMGRVVHVFLTSPVKERRNIVLPTDILLLVFENIFDAVHVGWRRDLISCALVCRDWSCALNFLLSDFRSVDTQLGTPPEIIQLAGMLTTHPNLCRYIKHLSMQYFERHIIWTRDITLKFPVPLDPSRPVQAQHDPSRRSEFTDAFLSIIRSSTHLQSLEVSPFVDVLPLMNDLPNTIRGLTRLESLSLNRAMSMQELLSCMSTWPSLKSLTITFVNSSSSSTSVIPSDPPACSLTELVLLYSSVSDDELAYFVSSSSSSLKRLTLSEVPELTNVGLLSILRTVSKSLEFLAIAGSGPHPRGDEEPAIDAVIADMERLETLDIPIELATKVMIERRSQAFMKRPGEVVLPEISFKFISNMSENGQLIAEACKKQWPGWRLTDLTPRMELLPQPRRRRRRGGR